MNGDGGFGHYSFLIMRDYGLYRLALSKGRRPLGADLYIHQRTGVNHSQWTCHDHSSINIAMSSTITSITLAIEQ